MKRITHLLLSLFCCAIIYGQDTATVVNSGLPVSGDTLSNPIGHLSLSVSSSNKVSLRWQVFVKRAESFFAVERSTNGTDFSVIGVIRNIEKEWFDFLDDAPSQGRVYYRVKLTDGQSASCSETVSVSISGALSCRFYPNPVDKALIVRTESPVDIQISDRFGKTVVTDHLQDGLKVIDVSALEPGIYIITLFQKDMNRFVSEKLVKK
jgi:hypothetical protein